MKGKIIKIFVDWCEKYKIENYRINSGSNVYGEEDILFYIHESEVPLKICFENKSIELIFRGEDDSYDIRTIDDSMIIEFADLCVKLREFLNNYNF